MALGKNNAPPPKSVFTEDKLRNYLIDEPEMLLHQNGLGGLLEGFSDFDLEAFTKATPSPHCIHTRILDALNQNQRQNPQKRYAEEQLKSRSLFLSLVLGDTFAEKMLPAEKRREAIFWRYVRLNPDEVLTIRPLTLLVDEKLKGNDTEFFIRLGKELAKVPNPRAKDNVNKIILKIAQYWTNDDYPLWLMNFDVAARTVGFLLRTGNTGLVSVSNYTQILRRTGLKPLGKFPIRNIRLLADGTFKGFDFTKGLSKKLDNLQ